MSSAGEMSKQQVEELVRKLAIDEMKSQLFDEIFAKVTSERNAISDTVDTPSTEEAVSPKSSSLEMATDPPKKLYQATVEDDPEEKDESCLPKSKDDGSGCSSASSVVSDSAAEEVCAKRVPAPDSGVLRDPEVPSQPRPRPSVRFSNRGPVILHGRPAHLNPGQEPPSPRREAPDAIVKDIELSAVDLKWGNLFDENGQATRRLGEVLRGIANFVITEYEPTNSLVITPEKLFAFYTKYKPSSEIIPFEEIFGQRDYTPLESLYQDLGCSYHLVQSRPDSKPKIPALTPAGFQNWMVRHIQAYPDQEATRLRSIVDELPIVADGPLVNGKQERLPRQLSRHLLPSAFHQKTRTLVLNSVYKWIEQSGEATSPKDTRETHHYRPSRPDDKSGRYRPEDYGSSRHRHKTREAYNRPSDRAPSSRKELPRHLKSRANSEGNIRAAKSRSPTSSSRYRTSVSSLNGSGGGGGGVAEDYNLSSSLPGPTSSSSSYSHHPRGGDRRPSREQEYRYYQSRGGPSDSIPRTVVGSSLSSSGPRRQSLVVDTTPREEAYDDYSPRSSRTTRGGQGVDEPNAYRSTHPNGGA
ncbi:hypothetical protein BGZ63DRAFT_365135 [Mariannaea sp. PMI_226]|nr:hypothetical protein BGZ63DRAFT_365135 [Mariannaea sp. PMI_226]